MSKTLGQRKRVPLFGFSDGFVVVALLIVVVVVPAGIKWRSVDRYSTEQAAIDARLEELPLTEVNWNTDVEVQFGTVDLPGGSRELAVQPSDKQADLATPIAKAALVGGSGQGVGVVGIDFPEDVPANDKLQAAGKVIDRMIDRLGVEADPFGLIRLRTDPAVKVGTSQGSEGLVGDYYFAPEATLDGTTIRIQTIDDGTRSAYIVSVWPAGEEDPVSDRMAGSVVFG